MKKMIPMPHSEKKEGKKDSEGMRLNKFVAHCGLCSRRKAADWVKGGKIRVNGVVEKNPAVLIQDSDVVEYNGKQIELEEELVYFLMNKPKNVITTKSDPQGRKTVMDLVRGKTDARIFPVGRLDRNTTGLLLLTNDGDLAKKLTHPSHEIQKVYEVELHSEVDPGDLGRLRQGLELEDGIAQVDAANYIKRKPRTWVSVQLHIGRNRIVRRLFDHLGYRVIKLDRVILAGLTKKGLGRGYVRSLREEEIRRLKHFS
ncbi:MAG: pseudouridine synthase [Bacteroidetes bacterium]|nr:pseudouridine synthase [Bacteroidota bacterium]